MDKKECNLEECGCSMVVAVTQDSINATLKEYLDNFKAEFTVQAYCVTVNEEEVVVYEEMDYKEVVSVVGMDLFNIPREKEKRTKEQNEAIRKAYEEVGFTLGFRFKIGLPQAEDVSKLRDIVKLLESDNTSIANVLYTMYLREFEIIKIASIPRKGYVFTSLKQEPNHPWYFTSRVKLDMKGKEFKQLPKEMQEKLLPKDASGSINMDQILSIQQLYMDLNTAKMVDEFELEGFDKTDEIYHLFENGFLKNYVEECKKRGGIVLGYFAKSFPQTKEPEFVKLQDFNFCITPYYKTDGSTDNSKQALYTLNYLFAASGEKLGDMKRYANSMRWNWVEENEKAVLHGRMAIDRGHLLSKISDHFKKALKCIQLKPDATADVNLVKADYSIWMEEDNTEPDFVYKEQEYEDSNKNKYSNGYFYSYEKEKKIHKSYVNVVDVQIKYQVHSAMVFKDNRILFETQILCYGKIDVDGGTAKGNLYNTTLCYGIKLGVNQNGKLMIQPDSEVVVKEGDTSISSDTWMDINSFGTGGDSLKKQQKFIKEKMNKFKENAIFAAKGAFSDMNYWVFPGGRVFAFKEPLISSKGNVLTSITYVEPSDEGKN